MASLFRPPWELRSLNQRVYCAPPEELAPRGSRTFLGKFTSDFHDRPWCSHISRSEVLEVSISKLLLIIIQGDQLLFEDNLESIPQQVRRTPGSWEITCISRQMQTGLRSKICPDLGKERLYLQELLQAGVGGTWGRNDCNGVRGILTGRRLHPWGLQASQRSGRKGFSIHKEE